MRNLTVALIVVIGILGGFYTGWKYSQSKVSTTAVAATSGGTAAGSGLRGGGGLVLAGPSGASGPSGAGGGRGAGGGGFGGPAAAGTVVSLSGNVLTVHDRASGKDVKVNLTPDTPVAKTTQGSASDLTPGANVTVIGTTATDGSVDARAISLGGVIRGG